MAVIENIVSEKYSESLCYLMKMKSQLNSKAFGNRSNVLA